ncbi:MAG: hypothetical protein KAV87_39780 [Desulfobacteraceae bacterium]|nr:hypothetical protein [Desulfobacteraceae bacterium]
MMKVKLREVAHSRGGEKGDTVNISVITYREEDYALIEKQVTVTSVRELYGPIMRGDIRRYEIPSIGALNFVLEKALEGGRSRTLAFDESGKALSSLILTMDIEVPNTYIKRSEVVKKVFKTLNNCGGKGE